MSKRNIIRVRDCVKITNPEIITRWGYPLSKQIVKDTLITTEQKEAICTLLRAFKVVPPAPNLTEPFDDLLRVVPQDTIAYDKVIDTMAYEILKQKKFGGKERKIYTERKESLLNAGGEVMEKKVVQSGTYNHGGGCYGYDGDFDFTPPYLSIIKAHVLCRVCVNLREGICENINNDGGVWIEMTNLQKII